MKTRKSKEVLGCTNAFELALCAAYSQGVGNISRGVASLTDNGGPGVSIDLAPSAPKCEK